MLLGEKSQLQGLDGWIETQEVWGWSLISNNLGCTLGYCFLKRSVTPVIYED